MTMASPLANKTSKPLAVSTPLSSDENTTQPLAQSTDTKTIPPQSYFKSTVQYSSAIALGQTIYIVSVFLSLAQFAVAYAQVLMLAAQEPKRLTENTSPSEEPSSLGTAVTDQPTAVTSPITRERYSSRIKRALVKTLSGNFAPVTLKRVTFDDEPIVERSEDPRQQQHRPARISEEDAFFATSPTASSPSTSPTGLGPVRKGGAHTPRPKSSQPPTKLDQIQRTQPKIGRANAPPTVTATTTTTTATKRPSLPFFPSSKSTTPSIAGGLRGINVIGSLGVAPETKSTIAASASSTSITQKSATEQQGLRRSSSAPSKNSPALRRNTESRENVAQKTVIQTQERFAREEEAPVEVAEKRTFSFFVTETEPCADISLHSPITAPISRPATPSFSETTLIEIKANEIDPPTSRNSLLVTSLETRARRSLSLARNRPSSIIGDDDRKELEERNRRRSSVQLDFPPATVPVSGSSTMERQGSFGKSAGKGFLYKIAHPQRYKRELQEVQLKRSASPSPPITSSIQQPRDQSSNKEAVAMDDSSSIRSLPSFSASPPAPQQQPRPSTPQPTTSFPSWPEYVDHLDPETVHSALYFPPSQPVTQAPDASVAATPAPPASRNKLLRRSKMFMDKSESDDNTSSSQFGHPPAPTTLSSDTSSVRPSFFTRSSSTASSEVTTPATTPSTSPRPSLGLHGSRTMSTGSPGKPAFGIAAALAGTTGVSTAMAGVARQDDQASLLGKKGSADDSASEHSVASSVPGTGGRGRSGFVKKLGLKK